MAGMNRHRLLAGLLLALCIWPCAPLQAETRWVPVMLADKGLFHYDPQSVSVSGRISQVRSLMDYKQAQQSVEGKSYLSTINDIQINCKSREARIMHTRYFSEARGTGLEVRSEGMIRDWLAIQPETVIDRIAKRVC